jgi:hypothetical protein
MFCKGCHVSSVFSTNACGTIDSYCCCYLCNLAQASDVTHHPASTRDHPVYNISRTHSHSRLSRTKPSHFPTSPTPLDASCVLCSFLTHPFPTDGQCKQTNAQDIAGDLRHPVFYNLKAGRKRTWESRCGILREGVV